MKHFNSYIAAIVFAIFGVVFGTNVNAQEDIDVDGNYIENPVEDAADMEDADFIEGEEDVSVTETKEEDGDTSVVEESAENENYADRMDKDILEDSVDTTDALEPTEAEAP